MNSPRVLVLAGLVALVAPALAAAQSLGTFRWQIQPYCNILSLSVVQQAGIYVLSGLAPGSVTMAELAPGAVGAPQLAPASVGSAAVANGSLTRDDLADPTTANAVGGNLNQNLAAVPTVIRLFLISAPASGRLIAFASGNLQLNSAGAEIPAGVRSSSARTSRYRQQRPDHCQQRRVERCVPVCRDARVHRRGRRSPPAARVRRSEWRGHHQRSATDGDLRRWLTARRRPSGPERAVALDSVVERRIVSDSD